MSDIIYDILIGTAVAVIGVVAKWQLPLIKSVFDKESRRQAEQIQGKWDVTETFTEGESDTFTMDIQCKLGKVTGTHFCYNGYDDGKEYDIMGSFKDHILAFYWSPKSSSALESGAVTVRLVKDKTLEGHGLYVEPEDGKIYTSTFIASKKA